MPTTQRLAPQLRFGSAQSAGRNGSSVPVRAARVCAPSINAAHGHVSLADAGRHLSRRGTSAGVDEFLDDDLLHPHQGLDLSFTGHQLAEVGWQNLPTDPVLVLEPTTLFGLRNS